MPTRRNAKSIFLLAADLSADAQRDLLDEHCAENPTLRGEVESLLLHDPGRAAIDNLALSPEPAAPRSTLGPYTIECLIAEGGSSAVYIAHQSNPSRRVALKVLRRGIAADAWRRRFEREAEILARLDHPGIAHFYAFGTTPSPEARVFIAMELVEGETITAFAERHALTIPQRIQLLAQACDAAEYGHRRGVIHRDLKPGNILVSLEPGADVATARVRLIDFGVARAADTQAAMTTTGVMVGTPAYMSPEQVRADHGAIDARSDVYSLGVVLYELCSGQTPFGAAVVVPMEMLRRIAEEEPTRLGLVNPTLRGDLEVLTAKALARDAAHRYQTAAQFADELRRFVDQRPILARRPSMVYLARSFVRRNRVLTVAIAASMLFLIGAASVSVWAGLKSREEARESAEEAAFWQETMESLWRVPGSHALRRTLLANAIPHIERRAKNRPESLTAGLTLARAYTALSDVDMEESLFAPSRQLRERALALLQTVNRQHPADVQARRELARVIILLGDVDEKESLYGPMFDRYRAALAMHESLAAENPAHPGVADDRFWSYQRLADQYARCGDFTNSDSMLDRQNRVARENYNRWPDSPEAMFSLACTLVLPPTLNGELKSDPSRLDEALKLAHRLAISPGAGKQHISLYVRLASRAAITRAQAGESVSGTGLMTECLSLLESNPSPPGKEALLDDAWYCYLEAKASIATVAGNTKAATEALRATLIFAKSMEAAGKPGNPRWRGAVENLEAQIRGLEAAGN